MGKTMEIKEDTYERLTTHAKWGETLDTAINRVLDELEECKKGVKPKRQTISFRTEGEDNLRGI
jgi:hypothetical protein